MIATIRNRISAWVAYRAARAELLHAASRYAHASDLHMPARGWLGEIVRAHRRMVEARRRIVTGRAPA